MYDIRPRRAHPGPGPHRTPGPGRAKSVAETAVVGLGGAGAPMFGLGWAGKCDAETAPASGLVLKKIPVLSVSSNTACHRVFTPTAVSEQGRRG